jgi:hypothetical protein
MCRTPSPGLPEQDLQKTTKMMSVVIGPQLSQGGWSLTRQRSSCAKYLTVT